MDVKNVYLAAESLYWAAESINACRRLFPPEEKVFSSRGRMFFLPREILPTQDTGKTASHIVSIFRPCADEPFCEEPSMIANRETPHGGISMHTMYDNREKSGRILALLEEKP